MQPNAVRLSRALAWIFRAGFVAAPVLTVLVFLNLEWVLQAQGAAALGVPAGFDVVHPESLPVETKLLGLVVACVPLTLTCAMLANLAALFAGYARGEVFTAGGVRRIRRVGLLLLVRELAAPFVGAAMSVALTLGNPPGGRMLVLGFESANLTQIVTALTILMAGYVMDQGRQLHDDAQLTI